MRIIFIILPIKYIAIAEYSPISISLKNITFNKIIAVSSLNLSLDNLIFYDDTNGFTVSLFNNEGDIIYCTTDIYRIGENITNSSIYKDINLLGAIHSNNTVFEEAYNEKSSSKYFYILKPIHMFDDVYWGIELAVSAKAEFFSNYKIIIFMWIIISAAIKVG